MNSINSLLTQMEKASFGKERDDRVYISISSPAQVLMQYYKAYFASVGETFYKHPSLQSVCDWLKDNHGKGLLLYGACSQGKTILAKHILPAVICDKLHKIVNYYRMVDANRTPDEVMTHKLIVLDDVGTEEIFSEYGNKRHSFNEIIDAVEQYGKLAIITTNMSFDDIERRYGTRTLERILATCTPICFNMCQKYYTCSKVKSLDICNEDRCSDFALVSFRTYK